MTGPAVSVLTPTYNRAHVLHRVYDSLCRQKTRDFEWVVVDDGSTDDTPDLLARWQAEADFLISWFRYSNNRGQIPATNEGRRLVTGEYTLKLDSDDALLDDAMETIAAWRTRTGIDSMSEICGLVFRVVDESGNIVGRLKNGQRKLPQETMILSTRAARYRWGMGFDAVQVQKTAIFSKMTFGELDNSENLPPSIGANRLSDLYKVIYVDHPLHIYYRSDDVARLSDKPTKEVKWPRGNYLRALAILNEDIEYFWESPNTFLNAARKVTRLGAHIGRPLSARFSDLTNRRGRLLCAVSLPAGYAGYLRDLLRKRAAPKADPDISAWGPAAPPKNPALHPPPARFRE